MPTLLVAAFYARRVLTLRDRGHAGAAAGASRCSRRGILILLVAFVSPVHALGEQMFSFHMLQHVLLGDLAPLALLAGLTGPILRPALRWLYRLRFLANPLVALPLWAFNLYLWHLPFLYDAAVRHDSVHALEHFCFFAGGADHVAARAGDAAGAGVVRHRREARLHRGRASRRDRARQRLLLVGQHVFYGVYEHQNRLWGLSALADQGIAGAVMMIEGSIVTLVALAWLFLRMASEGELRQQLLERGLDPRDGATGGPVRPGGGTEPLALNPEAPAVRSTGVHHVDLVVSSIERSLPFYTELLGPLGFHRVGEVEGERGETIWYLSGPGSSVGLREAQSDPTAVRPLPRRTAPPRLRG